MTLARYFIALIPPEPVFSEINNLKHEVARDFNSSGALKSPPHITIHMPFLWKEEKEDQLKKIIEGISFSEFEVTLVNFAYFPPRVVYIDVVPSTSLRHLFLASAEALRGIGIHNADYKSRGFVPHITIGFRDLKPAQFHLAKARYSERNFEATFMAERLELLKHNGKKWQIVT